MVFLEYINCISYQILKPTKYLNCRLGCRSKVPLWRYIFLVLKFLWIGDMSRIWKKIGFTFDQSSKYSLDWIPNLKFNSGTKSTVHCQTATGNFWWHCCLVCLRCIKPDWFHSGRSCQIASSFCSATCCSQIFQNKLN